MTTIDKFQISNNLISSNDLDYKIGVEDRDFTKARLNEKLTPWQVTGLVDGEGSFTTYMPQTDKGLFSVSLEFKVVQKAHSEGLLYEL